MPRHANPRFYLGPQTNELLLALGRAFGVQLAANPADVTIEFSRRGHGYSLPSVWTAYSVDAFSRAHFEVPALFASDPVTYPIGFYDGKVKVGDCEIADVELIKAPGHYAVSGESLEQRCAGETDWVEPFCPNDSTSHDCACNCQGVGTCTCSVKDGCPTCFNECYVAKAELTEGYAGLVTARFQGADLYTVITAVTGSSSTQGDVIRWEVRVCNDGPDPTSGVVMDADIPDTMVETSANGVVTKGSYVNTGQWLIGNLAAGECQVLILEGTTDPTLGGGIADVTATAAVGDTPDTNVTPDVISAPVVVGLAPYVNLVTTKTNTLGVIPSPVLTLNAGGDTFSFTIEVTNSGTQTATGVTLTDFVAMPTAALVASAASQGTYNAATGVWDIGNLPGGASVDLTLDMQSAVGAPIGYIDTNTTIKATSNEFDGTDFGNSLSSSVTYA